MEKSLVVVESPAKAKTIKKYLGSNFQVMASVGHVKDLPQKELGVDIDKDFEPKYVVIKGKSKVLKQIADASLKSKYVFLATDPDREGEAIAWHIAEEIEAASKKKKSKAEVKRALFHEITSKSIKLAIEKPLELNRNLYEAQQARRVLDRLVGYQISPLLWDKVRRGLSAGRVQSVAVRIICEREDEIEAFKVEEYWSIVADLEGKIPPKFESKLVKIDAKDFKLSNEADTKKVTAALSKEKYILKEIVKKDKNRYPSPPFITSTLQQEAARKLGFTAKKTMMLAQRLYEGVELGNEGAVALITYMRTDSTRLSNEALNDVRDLIAQKYGKDFLPEKPIFYKSRKSAQEAHEAIRPISVLYPPEKVAEYLEKDMLRLYDLIWKRFVSCQMTPAKFAHTTFEIEAGKYNLRATGQIMIFAGFISVYMEGMDEEKERDEEDNPTLPDLSEGEELKLLELKPNQHFTKPPPRFSEASLVKELEEKGIGRPSTYASILSTIVEKTYVDKLEGRFKPTELGRLVNQLLVESFPTILDVGFTAKLENELDEVEEGKVQWVKTLKEFYKPFSVALLKAKKHMHDVKRQSIPSGIKCEKCGAEMVVKWGRHGEFLACSKYPECRSTKEFKKTEDGKIEALEKKETSEVCEKCGAPMLLKFGRFGEFYACSNYPQCKSTKSISTKVVCPECNAGELVQRQTRKGKIFYSCSKYPDCKFAVWDLPVAEKCPQCGFAMLVRKYPRKGGNAQLACPNKECGYKREEGDSGTGGR